MENTPNGTRRGKKYIENEMRNMDVWLLYGIKEKRLSESRNRDYEYKI